MAKALSAMRVRACRRPAGAKTLTEERTLSLLPLGNGATRSAAIVVGIPMVPPFGGASINAVNRTTAASLGHSRKARGFLPGVDIEPRKRGKDA